MSFGAAQTPQRPLPGAFFQTPAPVRTQPQRQSFPPAPSNPLNSTMPQSQNPVPREAQTQPQPLRPVQRAARTINEALQRDASFPDLDNYVRQGISSNYDLPSPTQDTPWAPYQKCKMYDIPDKIFEQYNRVQVRTIMGLFADLNHAWITIDNALYLWDYTATNPELIGFEDQPNSITAVSLVKPRKGVFIKAITHVLVVATTSEMLMLGVEAVKGPTGIVTITVYQTKMSLSIKGIDVQVIEGSSNTGRIFFTGSGENDVYEMTYQQEERWFSGRCGKINHTSQGYASLVPATIWNTKPTESIVEMVIDDSRNLLYTLSSHSTICTFHMDTPTTLKKVIKKSRQKLLIDISHMLTAQTPLFTTSMRVVAISSISAKEASKLHLMATTSTGCRLFLSATGDYNFPAGKANAPESMKVQHIKFPPRTQTHLSAYSRVEMPTDIQSQALRSTRKAFRTPPGCFLCFFTNDASTGMDQLFLSAPDTGRIAAQARETPAHSANYYEHGAWLRLESRTEAIGLVTKPFEATTTPVGFGNELAVQFDEPPLEIAILTNTGVHTIRRRRLVDMFAAAIRQNSGELGLEGRVNRFIDFYGRGEVIAAALAVACGQGTDVSSTDARVAKITDKTTLNLAQKAFIEFGGRPYMNDSTDVALQAVDRIRPSARHEGLAIYMSRLVRSLWKSQVVALNKEPKAAIFITSKIPIEKLRTVQDDVSTLDEFLTKNSSFIEGLTRPEDLQRISSKLEEIALQGEHQALHSLQVLTKNIVEGINFVLMLFEEHMDEIWASLDETTRPLLEALTYESLFASTDGRELAKLLVKAIVNRNIASGSNVDTVADALRRKCRSFCSAGDVLIFKAQEQLKRASEVGASTDMGRNLLHQSLELFKQVADSLYLENLQSIIKQYTEMQFYAGAIQLCLKAAKECDSANRALAWTNDGKPEHDDRAKTYEKRKRYYVLIYDVLQAVDRVSSEQPEMLDGRLTLMGRKRNEAYAVINESDDEVFHYDLYDWYLSQGWMGRILSLKSNYVVVYLERLSNTSLPHANLLWKFYATNERHYEAATVQLLLSKSEISLTLKQRVEYLSRAKANASIHSVGVGRQAQQSLLQEVSELLEVANIQDEILQRLRDDSRVAPENKQEVVAGIDGQILSLSELYNGYADQAGYFDICLLVYQAADHRNPADIEATWMNLVEATHNKIIEQGDQATEKPYEAVIAVVRDISYRLNLSENIFPPAIIIPMLERYAFEHQRGLGAPSWVMDLFIEIGVPYDTMISVLQNMIYNDEAPFRGNNRRIIAKDMLYVLTGWYKHCISQNERLFGGEENALTIIQTLTLLTQNGLQGEEINEANNLKQMIERVMR